MMPAIRAVCNGSPFFTARLRIARRASAFICTSQTATASRAVAGLAPTSTICARPWASTCDKRGNGRVEGGLERRWSLDGIVVLLDARQEEREALHRYRQIHVLQLDLGRNLQRPR